MQTLFTFFTKQATLMSLSLQFVFPVSLLVVFSAHHQVPSCCQGQQEGCDGPQGHGQVAALPDSRRNSLSSFQLGSSQRSGEFYRGILTEGKGSVQLTSLCCF
jgi:hypothetical protein